MNKKLYITNYEEYLKYENIYHAILNEALAWSEDNGRIDNNCFQSLYEVLGDEEIIEINALKGYTPKDILFVVSCVLQGVEIYYDDLNLGR